MVKAAPSPSPSIPSNRKIEKAFFLKKKDKQNRYTLLSVFWWTVRNHILMLSRNYEVFVKLS